VIDKCHFLDNAMKLTVKSCELFPLMGIHSQDTKHAGAWRLHVLAATLDHTAECDHANGICKGGSGKIERATLEAAAMALGVKRSTFYTWLADARAAGILRGEGDWLGLASQEKLSQILLCNSIDKHKAIIPLKLLFKPGWKDVVWAAYLKVNHHKHVGYTADLQPVYKPQVISGRTLEALTGIPERTQRRLNKHVRSRRNIAITTQRGSYEQAAGMNEAAQANGERRRYFIFNDMKQTDPAGVKDYRRVIAHTMPARRTVTDKVAKIGARGRRKQIERAIVSGLRLVTVCNYSDCDYPAPPPQANNSETETEYAPYPRRYFDRFHSLQRATPRAGTFIERPRRSLVGVWDRVGG
jgi:hypothetical protein